MISLQKLKYFIDVVEQKSFTKAAKKNHVAQTSVSQQIKELEDIYNFELINRKSSPISVTRAGRIFYQWAKIVMSDLGQLDQQMEELKHENLQIAYTSFQDLGYLNAIFAEIPEYQDKIEVTKDVMSNLTPGLRSGVYDLAISFDSEFIDDPDINTIPIVSGYYMVGMRKDHPLAEHVSVDLSQVCEYPIVMINPGSLGKSYQLMVDRFKDESQDFKIAEFADNVESELFLIQQKQYIGFFPEGFPISLENPNLKLVKINNSPHKYEIALAYNRKHTKKTEKLLTKIKKVACDRFNQ
ncbi:LysR family transcriptional regulator [Lactobacillus corticis]|nr:LysR family transcriptional regulator [Lactobacillus corticis]